MSISKTDNVLWQMCWAVAISAFIYFALGTDARDISRVGLSLLGLLLPFMAVSLLERRAPLRESLGSLPEPLIILVGGAAGFTIWPLSWWTMDLLSRELGQNVGLHIPPYSSLDSWPLEVIYFSVLLPLGVGLLIFGLLRARLSEASPSIPPALSLGLMLLSFAALNTFITPYGLVALAGYGILGLVASFVSLEARSLWPGLAAYGVFMFANLAFIDDLGRYIAGYGFFEGRWLLLILFSAFITLLLTQVIRFRAEAQTKLSQPEQSETENAQTRRVRQSKRRQTPAPEAAQGLTVKGGLALLILVGILIAYAGHEIDQRGNTPAPFSSDQIQAE